MAKWLKITRINIEVADSVLAHQSAIINLDAASAFAVPNPGSVTVFIDGKGYVIQQQLDEKAYRAVIRYIDERTQGQTLP
ncbi:MAG: hypothetical protein K8I60_08170 [Anaerolineae bacterium]|nr:hypothetical protein [Anaerolineae bacterium]